MMISAQVSLYPLRQEDLSLAIEDVFRIFRAHSLNVNPGSMSTVISGDGASVFAALQEAFISAAGKGQVVMTVTCSNACPLPDPGREK